MKAAITGEVSDWGIFRRWWSESAAGGGQFATGWRLLGLVWEFLRDSTAESKRRRYGDVDYDWEHRVETSSATVGWRDRWRGMLLSAYQATESALFSDMLSGLEINFEEFTFLDLGSGKGRTLLMASDFPFRRIIGIEILPELHRVAASNLEKYKSSTQRCYSLQSICADATDFPFPLEATVLYLFNPLPEAGLARVIANLDRSLDATPRPIYVLYHNPLLEHVLAESRHLRRWRCGEQYSVWTNQNGAPASI